MRQTLKLSLMIIFGIIVIIILGGKQASKHPSLHRLSIDLESLAHSAGFSFFPFRSNVPMNE